MAHYYVYTNNIHVEDSARIPRREFGPVLDEIAALYPECQVLQKRSRYSLKCEWAVHNLLYNLGVYRKRTRDVDLDYPSDQPEWLYKLLGSVALLMIK